MDWDWFWTYTVYIFDETPSFWGNSFHVSQGVGHRYVSDWCHPWLHFGYSVGLDCSWNTTWFPRFFIFLIFSNIVWQTFHLFQEFNHPDKSNQFDSPGSKSGSSRCSWYLWDVGSILSSSCEVLGDPDQVEGHGEGWDDIKPEVIAKEVVFLDKGRYTCTKVRIVI